METPTGFGAGFAKGSQEGLAVLIVLEDGFAAVSAIHNVIDSAGILDAQFSGHAWI